MPKQKGKKVKLTEFHKREAIDRAMIALTMFETTVDDHPAIRQHPVLNALSDDVRKRLDNLYMALGKVYL